MESLKKVKGWVFDLDGTLVDSRLDFDHLRQLMQIPHGSPILEYLAALDDHEERQRLMKIVDEYEWNGHLQATLIDQVDAFLSLLKARGLPMALLTRNSQRVASAGLDKFGLHYFDQVISRDHDLRPKPHPDGLLAICEQWQLAPEDIVYVGDYDFDMQAARNAGSIGLFFNPAKRPVPSEAHFAFAHYDELLKLFLATV